MNERIIPQEVLDNYSKNGGYLGVVHVEGWNSGCCFIYDETIDGVHHLRTPKTNVKYTTRNNLLYKKNREN